jgi:hypothetical protein
MILISHRGNLNGKIVERENHPDYIDEAIKAGFDVEIDVRLNGGVLYLGHDAIQYEVSLDWLKKRMGELWIHCKNIEALEFFSVIHYTFIYFWHEKQRQFWMFTLYNKDEMVDLSPKDRKLLMERLNLELGARK